MLYMGLSIDWGTLVVSVPVVAATCFGAIKYIGKAYLKEHFDQRLETFKAELEKEKNAYIKELEMQVDKNRKLFEMYSQDTYQASQEVREQMRTFIKLYNSSNFNIDELLGKRRNLEESLDSNRIYISKDLSRLVEDLIKISIDAASAKQHYYYLRDQSITSENNDRLKIAIENHSLYSEKIKLIHNNIENLLRDELKGYS